MINNIDWNFIGLSIYNFFFNSLLGNLFLSADRLIPKISFKVSSEYKGAWRRFEIKKIKAANFQLTIISDYAHHPTEIEATLKAARQKYLTREIWCIFQPHQYQRTFYLFDNFVKTFKRALAAKELNKLILTDIYDVAGREDLSYCFFNTLLRRCRYYIGAETVIVNSFSQDID